MRENSAKIDTISNLLNNNKVVLNNEQKLSNIDKSYFENPKRAVKSKIVAEDKTKSNNFVSPDRFSCLNNYKQFENSIDFSKKIVHNVTSSNKSTTSKVSTDISCTIERSKNLLEIKSCHHNTRQ